MRATWNVEILDTKTLERGDCYANDWTKQTIDGLNAENYNATVKFVLFLSESQKKKSSSDKDAFFDAVGKINLNPDDVNAYIAS